MLRTIAILRARSAEDSSRLAEMSWRVGIDLVEVAVQGELGWNSLAAVSAVAEGRRVGAGTVLSSADVKRAAGMGASVVISPHVASEVAEAAESLGVTYLPGVMTPTDVAQAGHLSLNLCKLFPASILGSQMIGALRGPFPDVGFVAVGGINPTNALEFIEAGASGVAFGSSLDKLLHRSDAEDLVGQIHHRLEVTDG